MPYEYDTTSFLDSLMDGDNRPCYLITFPFTPKVFPILLHDALYPKHFKLDKVALTDNG